MHKITTNVFIKAIDKKPIPRDYSPNDYIKPTYIKLNNIININTEDNVETLTNICTIKIARKDIKFLGGDLIFENTNTKSKAVVMAQNYSEINVIAGYDNKLIEIFSGYIVKFDVNNEFIIIHCEDEMNKLKRSKYVKNSFPAIIKANTIRGQYKDKGITQVPPYDSEYQIPRFKLNTQTIFDDFNMIGQETQIAHILLWLFEQYGFNNVNTDDLGSYFNFDFGYDIICANIQAGKIIIGEPMTIAEILEQLKKIFGIYIYFIKSYRGLSRKLDDYGGYVLLPHKTLNVGWKYPHLRKGIEVSNYLLNTGFKQFDESKLNTYNKQCSITNYYKKLTDKKRQYNVFKSDNLVWQDTNKNKLQIIGTSIINNERIIAKYPNSENKLKFEIIKGDTDDNGDKNSTAIKSHLDDNIIMFNDNKENIIRLNLHNLKVDELKKLVENKYNNYPDIGYSGNIELWGSYPITYFINIGDVVTLIMRNDVDVYDEKIDTTVRKIEKHYSYYIDKVVRTINKDVGYTQTITLGNRYYSTERKNEINDSL